MCSFFYTHFLKQQDKNTCFLLDNIITNVSYSKVPPSIRIFKVQQVYGWICFVLFFLQYDLWSYKEKKATSHL